ncbi:MAG: FAD-binding oxidoreductase [Pelolinea sp.]|nr:FAD-binding oxidoreductase [Pelolinea sp.]
MAAKKQFTPDWYEGETQEGSYRRLFRWHDPKAFKHPNRGFYTLLRDTFGMTDADFKNPRLDIEPFDITIPSGISKADQEALAGIVGAENFSIDTYKRTRASYGAGMIDALRLRDRIVENICDAVAAPRNRENVIAIVAYCSTQQIPVTVYGGGSTITRGMEAPKGGLGLDLSVHMKRVLAFNETDQTITVEPGIYGPELEDYLNHAPEKLGAHGRYTCGHFPQSFEHSCAGGWVVTRGAGQNSTYYGKIEDLVLSQEYITPHGILQTPAYARCATGPDFNQLMMGSEGTFGILTAVTLKVFKYFPESKRRFSFLFKTWEDAYTAYRECMQGEFGLPSVFRLSDPEETDTAVRIYHIHGTPADSILRVAGYQPMQRCLLLGYADGDPVFTRLVKSKVTQTCRRHGAVVLSPFGITKMWEKSRFTDPYMREDLMDYGILIDTLECGVTWDQLPKVHAQVREVVKKRPQTVCMTHISHAYPQGANLYFIFVIQYQSINDYLSLQYSVLEAIQKSGAAMSHHHGIGKQTAPWLEGQIGQACMDVLRTLKKHSDPQNIMNPGGTLGLDMNETQKEKRWGFR